MAQNTKDSKDVVAKRRVIEDPQPEQVRASIEEERRVEAHQHNLRNHKRLLKDRDKDES